MSAKSIVISTLLMIATTLPVQGQQRAPSPEQKAVNYLGAEVPKWSRENNCFSCHNNGDGARALYAAAQAGLRMPAGSLADTTQWLLAPHDWDSGPANPAFNDRKLIRVQFAASLAEAYGAGLVQNRQTLIAAAESLLPFQETDGAWQVRGNASVGSPVTYGPVLATYMARMSLELADRARFADAIARATGWLAATRPTNNMDTAALLLALPADSPYRQENLANLLAAQNMDGGWGVHTANPSEVFDTAMALLALKKVATQEVRGAIVRGREFLIAEQLATGGWMETTRPSGGTSYAQHISTSAWATLALLATHSEP